MGTIKKLTFQQACKMTGHDPVKSLPYPKPADNDDEAYNALKRLQILTEAYNMVGSKKWVADYSDDNQVKWRIIFIWDESSSAFRFYFTSGGYSIAYTGTGSRHAIRTDEIAVHIGTAHLDEWNKWLVK